MVRDVVCWNVRAASDANWLFDRSRTVKLVSPLNKLEGREVNPLLAKFRYCNMEREAKGAFARFNELP